MIVGSGSLDDDVLIGALEGIRGAVLPLARVDLRLVDGAHCGS